MTGARVTDSIRFILNGEEREVKDLPPTTTLLQYLRRHAHLNGAKEGCAEGDCGACTVMAGRLQNGAVDFRSINACIALLPALDGQEIVTVEHLQNTCGGAPHPVQAAMAECHAAQCGFCTPGFVMALTALAQHNSAPSRDDVQDAVAGNLCRCTGYRPILDAAEKSCGAVAPLKGDAKKLASLQRREMMVYQTAAGVFLAPVTVDELAQALAGHPDAVLLAGGTDVGLWVTKMHRDLPVVIYTGNVAGLRRIEQDDTAIKIGAAVTYSEAFAALAALGTGMDDFLRRLGSAHIRNAGTLGGNIANGSPIGDGMPPLIALGARIVLRSAAGSRTIALEDYFVEYRKQDRRAGEFLETVIIPRPAATTLFRAYKVSKRFDQDISAVCAAFALEMEGNTIRAARVAYGGMAGTPKRAAAVESALTGEKWDDVAADAAMRAVEKDFQPLSDMRASAGYRLDVARNLIRRCLLETTTGAATGVYRYGA